MSPVAHYSLDRAFYELWLDVDLSYTCAFFDRPTDSLEVAQQAKHRLVCRKLMLRTGLQVVEAGGGWGGLALYMARHYGVRVRSFNICHEQVEYARERARSEGLDRLVEFVHSDFGGITGRYDVFVSVGMFEHVTERRFVEFGRVISRSLNENGVGLIHTIGRDIAARPNRWIVERVFPGAYPPSLAELTSVIGNAGMSVVDIENLRWHYWRTLHCWLDRYEQAVGYVSDRLGEAFSRAWLLYLNGSAAAFESGSLQLFQVVFFPARARHAQVSRAHLYTQNLPQMHAFLADHASAYPARRAVESLGADGVSHLATPPSMSLRASSK